MSDAYHCPSDLRIVTLSGIGVPSYRTDAIEIDTRTCAAIAHVRGFNSKLVRLTRPISLLFKKVDLS